MAEWVEKGSIKGPPGEVPDVSDFLRDDDVSSAISGSSDKVASDKAVKDYVDAQIGSEATARQEQDSSLQTQIGGKANVEHSHEMDDVTGLNDKISEIETSVSGKANATHTHTIESVTGLQDALDGKADVGSVTLASLGVTATAEELNYMDGVTSNVQTQLGGKADSAHTHANATTSNAGFMSAEDKTKLNGLKNVDMTGYAKVVRNYSNALQDDKGWVGTLMITEDPVEATNFVQIRTDGGKPTFAMNTMEVNGFTDTITPDADGYSLATDKAVKDYVDANKTTVTVDDSLSDSSTNPVQNKVIKAAVDGKANVSHTHDASDVATGTLDAARIPTITDDKIQSVSANKITGTIPSGSLPSYVDDVVEYDTQESFPPTGEAGKIYVDTTTNKTYRWGGSEYVEISASLALGNTSATAFRGDHGEAAYNHAVTNKGSAFASGLYKITTNAEGHVTAATSIVKGDITGLGIPAQDTTYVDATTGASGLMSAADKTKLDGIANGANNYTHPTSSAGALGSNIYKITTDATGHITAATPITKGDITALGIPGEDTNTTYEDATASLSGLMSAADKTKLDGIADGADKLPDGGTDGQVLTKTTSGEQWADLPVTPITKGGTGANNAADARANLGITVASDEDFKAFMGIS